MTLAADLLAPLCVFEEAANQPYEGKVAVAVVIARRTAQKYQSDGTVEGTILAHNQFSWTEWEMVDGHYTRVAHTPEEQSARVESLLPNAQRYGETWRDCVNAWSDAQPVGGGAIGAAYAAGGPEYQKLVAEPRALLYVNLAVSQPAWATPDKFVAKIHDHSFYRA